MTLEPSRLRELDNPNLSVGGKAELCCELSRELEDKGEYEEARKVFKGLWQRIGERPKLEGLDQNTAAEVLLRVGVLTGVIGSKNQITNAQETAKNLISESLAVWESRSAQKKIAEAQAELALCYWRIGEINNARDVLKDALSRLTTDSELKARVINRMSLVEHAAGSIDKAIRILTDNAPLFEKIQNPTVKGGFHVTLGNRLKDLSKYDRALIEYTAASYHFEQAGHRCYLANVENNLGVVYYKVNRLKEAHEHLDRARRVLVSLKDNVTLAQVDETRACVFLAQDRIAEAERVARSSVRRLEQGDRPTLLIEALITHGRALARLEDYGMALSTLRRAMALAEQTGSDTWAAQATRAAFQEIGARLVVAERWYFVSGRPLDEELQSFEHDLIKHALDMAQGSITYAARRLGMTYQALQYKLENKYPDLLEQRTPVRQRNKGIFRPRG